MELQIHAYNSVCQVLPKLAYSLSTELDGLLSFGIEGAQWTPQYINNAWDGRKHLFSVHKQAFPTGYLMDVVTFFKVRGMDPEIIDKRSQPAMSEHPVTLQGKTPWEHQLKVFDAIANSSRGLIQVATGGGKTFCIAGAYAYINQPGVVLTYRKELMLQLRKHLQEFLGEPVGIFGGGTWEEGRLTVCMAQSLLKASDVKYAKLLKEFDETDKESDKLVAERKLDIWDKLIKGTRFVAVDECLPYRQMISTELGPVAIGRVAAMFEAGIAPRVWSLNAETQRYELQAVTHAWRRVDKLCVTVTYGRSSFTATPNHPVLTPQGYIPAGNLKVGDTLVGKVANNKRQTNLAQKLNSDQEQVFIGSYLGDGSVQLLPSGHVRLRVVHGPKQKMYAKMKADIFKARIVTGRNGGFPPNNLCHRFATTILSVNGDIPAGKKTMVPQWMIDALGPRALAIWVMDDGTLTDSGGRIHSYSFDEDSHVRLVNKLRAMGVDCKVAVVHKLTKQYLSISLSTRGVARIRELCAPYGHPCLAYKLPHGSSTYYSWDNRYADTSVAVVTGVRPWQTSSSKHGSGVFDIEVEKNHNFVVTGGDKDDGICVHNCHHLGANSSYSLLQNMENAYWRYGFSATAHGFREDRKDFFIQAAIGEVITRVTTSDLVDEGILVPTDVIMVDFSHAGRHYPKDSYNEYYYKAVVENDERNKILIQTAYHLYRAGKPVLMAVQRVDHGKTLELAMQHLVGPDQAKFVYGEDHSTYRDETLTAFKEGKLPVLISTLISEGVDIPNLAHVVAGRGESSRIATIQLMGRGMRSYPGKTKAVYVDVMDRKTAWLGRHTRTRETAYRAERAFTTIPVDVKDLGKFLQTYKL